MVPKIAAVTCLHTSPQSTAMPGKTSMVDVPLMRAVLRAMPVRAGLLLAGDVDQLPSVGPGAGSG